MYRHSLKLARQFPSRNLYVAGCRQLFSFQRTNIFGEKHSNLQQKPLKYCFKRSICKSCSDFNFYSRKWIAVPLSTYATKEMRLYSKSSLQNNLTMKNDLVKRYVLHLQETYILANEKLMSGGQTGEYHLTAMSLKPTMDLAQVYLNKESELSELQRMLQDLSEDDREMIEMAQTDITGLESELQTLDTQIIETLVPTEAAEEMDIIIELTAGAGGQEAMYFTYELFHMYEGYAAYRGWQFEPNKIDFGEVGGYRHASATIRGSGVYRFMKFEGGVHRVQRIPETEKASRIHTSTMAVAIMPLPSEIEVAIDQKDLQITNKTSSGAGGQHVNTTLSCVRIVHIPTGIAVECQVDRSGEKNRKMAMEMLRSKIYAKELDERTRMLKSRRKLQVGSLGRSEKIRTYNFQQDRISDHRVSGNLHDVKRFLSGGEHFDDMVHKLLDYERKEKLVEILENFDEQQKDNIPKEAKRGS